MAVEFDLEGFLLSIEISGWEKTDEKNWDSSWCQVKLNIKSNCMEYYLNSEILLSSEVNMLIESIESSLKGNKTRDLEFIEPDLEFRFHEPLPEEGIMTSDMEFIVRFWDNGVLTSNYLCLCMDMDEMNKFHDYLITVRSGM